MFETIFIPAAVAVTALMSLLFIWSIIKKRNDIVDIFWGPGIFLVSLVSYMKASQPNDLNLLLTLFCGLWACRLAFRIYRRNRGKDEDFRYKKWREEWGSFVYVRSFFQIYALQGFLMLVLGLPFMVASYQSELFSQFSFLAFAGAVVWLIGYFFEVVGDKQLDQFIKNKTEKDAILDTGLWRYTRHPNYFGEVVMWWGIWLTTISLPLSYIAIISPLTITFLILRVSGVPMLEKKYAGDPKYEAYKQKTSVFLPLPPRK